MTLSIQRYVLAQFDIEEGKPRGSERFLVRREVGEDRIYELRANNLKDLGRKAAEVDIAGGCSVLESDEAELTTCTCLYE